jgi:hypothetical protein
VVPPLHLTPPVPSKSVLGLWEAYTLLSDGWGLDSAAFLAIVKRGGLGVVLGADDLALRGASRSLHASTLASHDCMADC